MISPIGRVHLSQKHMSNLGLCYLWKKLHKVRFWMYPTRKFRMPNFALWGFLVCAIRHIVKKGLLRHFITPKNCTKIMQKTLHIYSILHKNPLKITHIFCIYCTKILYASNIRCVKYKMRHKNPQEISVSCDYIPT